jgi:23S rRNA (guanosine2251-2'-O)-methyltransferase
MSDCIYGRNPVLNALKGSRKPSKILLSETMADQTIFETARRLLIPVEKVPNRVLDRMAEGRNHQGVIALLPAFSYTPLERVLSSIASAQNATLLVLDGIEDPVNLGSLIRTSCAFGVSGIILGKNREVQVTPTVSKVATGAEEIIPICQVVNISQTLALLKKAGFWVVAADGKGDRSFDEIDYSGKIALVIGSEGRGISRLVLDNSDFIARIPISGPITSLNAAVSGAIFLSMIASKRSHQN